MPFKVWLNGTFDVLHMGHIKLIQRAVMLGGDNVNIRIGVDTDERIRAAKGKDRPVNTLEHRIAFLHAIKGVDEVVSFGTDEELEECIREYAPDLMVIGDDYVNKRIIGEEHIELIHYMERYGGLSTTGILNH